MIGFYMSMADTPEEKSLIERLYIKYRGKMYGAAYRILKDPADAEDAVHDAFVKVFSKTEELAAFSEEVCGYYLYTAARNAALTALKKKKGQGSYESIEERYDIQSGDNVEEEAIALFGVEEIKDALRQLSDSDYELIFMTAYMSASPSDIAALIGESAGTVRQRLFRARSRLLNILNQNGNDI